MRALRDCTTFKDDKESSIIELPRLIFICTQIMVHYTERISIKTLLQQSQKFFQKINIVFKILRSIVRV